MCESLFVILKALQKQPPEVFCKKGFLKNLFTGKHLCQSLFFNKAAGLRLATLLKKRLRPATLLKKRLWCRCFPVNIIKFPRTPFFTEHLWTTASSTYRTQLKCVWNNPIICYFSYGFTMILFWSVFPLLIFSHQPTFEICLKLAIKT